MKLSDKEREEWRAIAAVAPVAGRMIDVLVRTELEMEALRMRLRLVESERDTALAEVRRLNLAIAVALDAMKRQRR